MSRSAVPYIAAALGHSVIYDEYRGDLAEARQIAIAHLEDARTQNDPSQLADALLARGVVHLLRGEPPAALSCFDEIEHIVPGDADRLLLAFGYAVLAEHLRFLRFPHGANSSTLELQVRWDPMAVAVENEQRWNDLFGRAANPEVNLHAALLYKVLLNWPIGRYVLDGSRDLADQEELERRTQMMLQPLQLFRVQVEAAGAAPSLLAGIDRMVADLAWRARYQGSAQQYLEEAHTRFEEAGDLVGVAGCWLMLGDWMSAPVSSPLVWNHLMLEGDWNNSLSWVRERSEFDRSGLRLDTARQAYAEAEKVLHAAGAKRGLGAVELRFGYLKMLAGEYDLVVQHVERAQQHFEVTGDSLGAWLARTQRALALVGADSRAEDAPTARAIGKWGKNEGSLSYATGLGLFFVREGRRWLMREADHERAMACYRLAHTLFQELGAADNATQTLADQGVAYGMVGEHTAALVLYEGARDGFIELSDTRPALGKAAWQKAVLAADEVCQIYQILQDADGFQRSLVRLRALYEQPAEGGPDLFGENFPDTLRKQVGLRDEIASVLVPLYRALDARDAGDEKQEEEHLAQALAAAHETGPDQRNFLEATVLRAWHRYPEGSAAFGRYLQQGGAAAGFIGDLATSMADIFGPAGQAVADQRREQTHRFAARFYADVNAFPEARAQLEALEEVSGEAWWAHDDRPWEALRLYGEVDEGLGRPPEEALADYARAIDELEARWHLLTRDETKIALAGERSSQYLYFYAARAAMLARQAALGESQERARQFASRLFEYAERGRARALLDLMATSADSPGATDPTIFAVRQTSAQLSLWRKLMSQERREEQPDPDRLAQLALHIKNDEATLRRLEAELAEASPRFLQPDILSLDHVRRRLPPDTALLQYYFLGEDLLVWAITQEGLVAAYHAEQDARGLSREIRAFHKACANPRQRLGEKLGHSLSKTLLTPLGEVIRDNQHLVITPYGASHLLPFHALPWDGEPLGVTHTVAYLPSASLLQFLGPNGKDQRANRLLAVGNPANMSYQPPLGGDPVPAPALPAAGTEAAFVASLFPGSKILLGDGATEAAVRQLLVDYPVLHLATHGYLSEEAPLLSSILLANGEALTVYELMGLQLNADLIVLSACETARGQTTGGDDVLGLTRGLLAAGARAAVVSLWPVNDVSTSLLMGEFYRHLRQNANPAAALQRAQAYLRRLSPDDIADELASLKSKLEKAGAGESELREVDRTLGRQLVPQGQAVRRPDGYRHPHYWAPFILVGATS